MGKKPPVKELRMGRLKAVVWANETQAGKRHNVTFHRLYLEDGQWQQSESFGRDDLLLLSKLANEVHSWIYQHGREEEAAEVAEAK